MTAPLRPSSEPLATAYDVALLDLDGVVYLSAEPIPHAAQALADARAAGMRLGFVTNNASRTPDTVAAILTDLGIPTTASDVITSAQAAARLVAERVPAGAGVLVVGADGLREAVTEAGLRIVASADDAPAAVLQGYAAGTTYANLAEAALAIQRGAVWVASNVDSTMPSPRGPLPGNGAMVAALRVATRREPIVAGKPEPALHTESVERTGATRPLVVGDRLDTDVAGAVRVGCDSLLVLTGVATAADVLAAAPDQRPTYLAADLRGLLVRHAAPEHTDAAAGCGGWRVTHDGATLEIARDGQSDGDPLDLLRALCPLTWAAREVPPLRPADRASAHALTALGLAAD